MARDNEAGERDEDGPVGRRSFLAAAGTGIASALSASALTSATATAAEYETIEVSSGETKNIDLGSGDTLENTLIDVTADGAAVSIRAQGDGWAIKNVGIKGPIDSGPKKVFSPSVPEGGKAVVENFYLGDGTSLQSPNRKGGVWVNANAPHQGELVFRNSNISGWADNGLYGSGAAYQQGSQAGSVKIENSYAANNNISNFRIGGDGSYVKNSTIVSDSKVSPVPNGRNSRGIWCKDAGDMLVENCDIVMTGPDATDAVKASHGASATVRNSRIKGSLSGDVSKENVSNDPSKKAPDGVPMTAEEAASGSGGGGTNASVSVSAGTDDSESEKSDEGESKDDKAKSEKSDESKESEDSNSKSSDPGSKLELVAAKNASKASYKFTVDGTVQKRSSAGDVAADSNDEVSDNGDGTVTVSGVAGNGYGDSFLIDGKITSMDLKESEWTIRYEGEKVNVADLSLSNKLVIDGSGSPNKVSEYTFTVSGSARKSADLGTVNGYDTVSDGEISGRVIDGADGYRFSGDITGFELDGPAKVRVEQR